MKIKYRLSDGEIIAMGEMPNLQAGAGEAVEDYNGEMVRGRVDFFKRTANNTIVEKAQAEKDAILDTEKRFNPGRFLARFNALPDEASKLSFLARSISKLAYAIKESEV